MCQTMCKWEGNLYACEHEIGTYIGRPCFWCNPGNVLGSCNRQEPKLLTDKRATGDCIDCRIAKVAMVGSAHRPGGSGSQPAVQQLPFQRPVQQRRHQQPAPQLFSQPVQQLDPRVQPLSNLPASGPYQQRERRDPQPESPPRDSLAPADTERAEREADKIARWRTWDPDP